MVCAGSRVGEMEDDENTVEGMMARLSVRSQRVVRRVEENVRRLGSFGDGLLDEEERRYLEGTVFPWDGDDEDEDSGVTCGDSAAEHWHRCVEVVREELREMQREDPRLCAWYREAGTGDDRVHLECVMRKLGGVWRLRDHLLGCLIRAGVDGGEQAIREMAMYMMTVISAEELELEGLRVTRAVREKHGDEALPALEGWLGGERSVAWWLRESGSLEMA